MTPTSRGDDVAQLLVDNDVVRTGHFRLSSGKHSDTYLQCALALQHPAVALRLGAALAERLRGLAPDVVAAPALGGLLAGFAVAAALDVRFVFTERDADRRMVLRRGQELRPGERVVIVEDVVTTGGSAAEVHRLCTAAGAAVVAVAAIVDRSAGVRDEERALSDVVALHRVEPGTWDPEDCPHCRDAVPLDTPGSRHTGTGRAPSTTAR